MNFRIIPGHASKKPPRRPNFLNSSRPQPVYTWRSSTKSTQHRGLRWVRKSCLNSARVGFCCLSRVRLTLAHGWSLFFVKDTMGCSNESKYFHGWFSKHCGKIMVYRISPTAVTEILPEFSDEGWPSLNRKHLVQFGWKSEINKALHFHTFVYLEIGVLLIHWSILIKSPKGIDNMNPTDLNTKVYFDANWNWC